MSGRALVVGVTGISGGNLARRLLADGWEVAGLSRRPHDLDQRITPLVARESPPPFPSQYAALKMCRCPSLLAGGMAKAAAKTIQLAFCSNLLCAPPFEVTRVGGYFRDEGLDVQLVYMRGSTAATQALVGGALDYAATSFDDVLQAFDFDLAQQRLAHPVFLIARDSQDEELHGGCCSHLCAV